MEDEERINREIQSFLEKTTNTPAVVEVQKVAEKANAKPSANELVTVLTKLQNTYSKIHESLQARDEEGIKNEILKSDVKMSLVCESLVRVLRETYIERNEFSQTIDELKHKINAHAAEKKQLEDRIVRLENEAKYATQTAGELERFVRDQKVSLDASKGKLDAQRKVMDNLKLVNSEVDASRKMLIEKCEVSQREIEMLKKHIDDRAAAIEEHKARIRELETKADELLAASKTHVAKNEMLAKKFELKSKNLEAVNAELACLLRKEAKSGQVAPTAQENGTHAEETLYEDTILKYKEIKGKYKRMRKRLVRKAQSYDEQRKINEKDMNEIEKLRKSLHALSLDKTKEGANNKHLIDCMLKKIEGLIEKNYEYQSELHKLKMKEIEREKMPNISFKSCIDVDTAGAAKPNENKNNAKVEFGYYGDERIRTPDEDVDRARVVGVADNAMGREKDGLFNTGTDNRAKYDNIFSEVLFRDYPKVEFSQGFVGPRKDDGVAGKNVNEMQKYYTADNDYAWKTVVEHEEKKDMVNDDYKSLYNTYKDFVAGTKYPYVMSEVAGGALDAKVMHAPPSPRKPVYDQRQDVALRQDEFVPSAERFRASHRNFGADAQTMPFDETEAWNKDLSYKDIDHRSEGRQDHDDNASEGSLSVKTVSTTETLKNMLKKTERLRGKFNELEDELMNIRNINTKQEAPARDKLGYYYADIKDISNDPDFL